MSDENKDIIIKIKPGGYIRGFDIANVDGEPVFTQPNPPGADNGVFIYPGGYGYEVGCCE